MREMRFTEMMLKYPHILTTPIQHTQKKLYAMI